LEIPGKKVTPYLLFKVQWTIGSFSKHVATVICGI